MTIKWRISIEITLVILYSLLVSCQSQTKRLVLEGIQVQLHGLASRIMIRKSQDSRYRYVLTDANIASLKLNGIPGQGYNGIEVSNGFRPEVEVQVRILKGTETPIAKGKDGIARFDFLSLIAQGNAEARVVSKAKTVSVADGAIRWSFRNTPVITLSKDDKGEYYYDFPKLVRDGAATIVGQDGKSVFFDDGATVLTFKGNQDIPVSKDEEGRCYFDFPKFAAERGGLSVHLKQFEGINGSPLTILKPLLYTEGSEHIILSDMKCFGYRFSPDSDYPLVFKMAKDVGYTYLCGRGTVTTKDGKSHRLGYNDNVDIWIPLLKSTSQLDREGAAQALGWLAKTKEDKREAVPALIETLADAAIEVRRDAAESLGRIGGPQALESLKAVLQNDESSWVREVAKESIERIERPEPDEGSSH